jgi:hypothetical protein
MKTLTIAKDKAEILTGVLMGVALLGQTKDDAIRDMAYLKGVSEEWIKKQFDGLGDH